MIAAGGDEDFGFVIEILFLSADVGVGDLMGSFPGYSAHEIQ
jgi:hypothetical protein